MDPVRQRRVMEVCHEALELSPGERAGYVASVCGDDVPLRQEVEALLAHAHTADGFLAAPAGALVAQVLGVGSEASMVGRQVASYTIGARLGAGGMGEVYRARDTKLGREVAIKILPRVFTHDPERLRRFEREARMLAALNHPHIATIYGVEELDGIPALVLELVEGATLADRLAKGPISLSETLTVAQQIADALEAAHEKGIVHRDLKPANIQFTSNGVVKVLDFGLAKPATGEGSTPDLTQSPTITVGGTRQGTILGTAAYMSPEQARGRAVDKRSDIWAFGCVLYEMLTGSIAFAGDTVSDTIAKILEREPDWRALPVTTPANIRRLLQRCLEKDSKHRLRDIGDARMEIDDALAASARPQTPQSGGTQRRWLWRVVGASLALGLGVSWVVTLLPRSPVSMRTLRLTLAPPAGTEFVEDNGFAMSPDDRLIAFAARSSAGTRLWVRSLSSSTARELPGTDDAAFPFWSPDSRSLGFFAAGKLKRIDLAGGAPTVICNVGGGRGGTWNEDGLILFNSVNDGPLLRVAAAGGTPEPFTVLDRSQGENSHRWPEFLPGGRSFLYYVRNDIPERSGVYMGTMDRPQEKVHLATTTSNGIYVPSGTRQSGHLFWMRNGTVVAQAFEPATRRITGEPVRVAENVAVGNGSALIAASVSTDGTIVYHPLATRTYQLTWYGRDGTSLNAVGPPDAYVGPRISPDGRRVAVRLRGDIWQMELARGILTRVTFEGRVIADPVWSPDNQRIGLSKSANASGNPTLFSKSATGTGPEDHLLDSRDTLAAQDWSPDGRAMLYSMQSNDLSSQALDLWIVPFIGDKKPIPFVTTPFVEGRGQFSPDGKWVAYTSNESGRNEVYVQSFPVSGAKWQISNSGGDWVRWRRDGKELFYVAPNRELRSVAIVGAPTSPEFETSRVLFVLPATLTQQGGQQLPYSYDVMPDGQRILALVPTAAERPPLTVIVNWQAESSANTN